MTPTPASMATAKEIGVIGHYYCEDCWYSCPFSEDGGCCDDSVDKTKCNCGYDERLTKIALALEAEREAAIEECVNKVESQLRVIGSDATVDNRADFIHNKKIESIVALLRRRKDTV